MLRLTKFQIGICAAILSILVLGGMTANFFPSPKIETKTSEQKNEIELSALKKGDTSRVQLFQTPLYFEKNEGQLDLDAKVKYFTRAQGCTYYFTPEEVVMVLQRKLQESDTVVSSALKLQFVGAKQDTTLKGIEEQEYRTNYFITSDPQKWRTNIVNYAKVLYEDIYPGIDAIFYGKQTELEYDLHVGPGKNPQDIRLHFDGAKELSINGEGDLVIQIDTNEEMQMHKPIIYQMLKNGKIFVEGNFVLLAKNEIGFAVGNYDKDYPLIIDPTLSYSTYLGADTLLNSIAVDSFGNAYVTGSSQSATYPVTMGAFQTNFGGTADIVITKLNANGSALIYSTYLGGSSSDSGNSIAIDGSGNAYITGQTSSNNFPTSGGAFQSALTGTISVIVAKIDSSGSSLAYSTYIGGNAQDIAHSIAIDSSFNAYITGETTSNNFPTSGAVFQTSYGGSTDAFVTMVNTTGTALVYSSYLGGTSIDRGFGIALNGTNAYVVGQTSSLDFPTTAAVFQASRPGNQSGFVTQVNSTGSLVYSTYLGGSISDFASAVAVDSFGDAYVTGGTNSSNFPTIAGAFQTAFSGMTDAFVTQLNPTGTGLNYSTFLGGSNIDSGTSIRLDNFNNAYVAGGTTSLNFPTTVAAFQTELAGASDAFVTVLDSSGSSLIYSTYLGGTSSDNASGIAVDSLHDFYVTGSTSSTNFPTTSGAFQTQFLPGIISTNGFVTKFVNGPNVTGIVPNFGPVTGGTIVTISGSGFINVTSVQFGGTSVVFIVDSPTQITAISPPGVGVVDVTVTTILGTSAITPADQFTYVPFSSSTNLIVSPNPAPLGQPVTLTAVVAPPTATGTVTFFDGATPIATVPLVNGTASIVISSFTVGQHFLTAVYSGDADFATSTSPIVVLSIETALPPSQLRAVQRENKFATQTDIINILTWNPPSGGIPPVEYRIYRNEALTRLIAVIPANERLRFEDHNRKKDRTYTYWVVSVDQFGNVSAPAVVRVR